MASVIQARKMDFDFTAPRGAAGAVPRHWFGGSIFATHMANGLNLLFPLGERFFVRSVRAFADRARDPQLAADIRGFMAQEVRHGIEHERFFDILRAQGFEIDRFLRAYDAFAYQGIEKIAPKILALSVTAAAEHFTASFAERAFTTKVLDDHAHPTMRDLFLWHAAEEIEHKSVAYDLLQEVDPRHGVRVAGLVVATVLLVGLWVCGTTMLLAQEPRGSWKRVAKERRESKARGQLAGGDVLRAFKQYLRRDFHPSQNDDAGLAKGYFAKLAAEAAACAA